MIDVVYCWGCTRFSFIEREVISDGSAVCQHERCTSTKLGDVGDVQRELMRLAEPPSLIDRLIEFAPKVREMFEINGTPSEERKVGTAHLH